MSNTTTHLVPLSRSAAHWAVEQACRAPSLHNTQPWRFRWDGQRFEIYADTSRGLTATDPHGREVVLSCGAAMYNLRVALRKLGYIGAVTPLPSRSDPRLLASISVFESVPAITAERLEFAALTRRHTHRGGFDGRAIAADLAARLQVAAEEEGAQLVYVYDPGQRGRVLQLARAAEHAQQADERVAAETAAWTPAPGTTRRDGVPATTYSQRPNASPDELAARDFDQSRGFGRLDSEEQQPPGGVAVLTTERDVDVDWLRAGQALERVLLVAAQEWAFAALHSPVTEVDHLRAELRRELCTSGYPQILLRFGYAHDAHATPRRPVDDVLEVVEALR